MKSEESQKNKNVKKVESLHTRYKNLANEAVALQIFDIIEQNPRVSQRKITRQTGLAAGLVHSFMSRVIGKGWIRARQVNPKRWFYFLTPEGFVEKSRLSMAYLSSTLNSYRLAQRIVQSTLNECFKNNWRKLLIIGNNELAEIVVLNIKAVDYFILTGIVSANGHGKKLMGHKILPADKIHEKDFHKILVCDIDFPDLYNGIINKLDKDLFLYLFDHMHSDKFPK